MAKKRRQQERRDAGTAQHSPAMAAGGAPARWLAWHGALLALGLVAAAVYAYGFYYATRLPTVEQQVDAEDFRRIDVVLYVIRPDLFPSFFLDRWFAVPRSLGMVDRLPVLFGAAAILAVAAAAGWLLLGLARVDRRWDRLETFVFSVAVGLAATSTYVLAVGLLGWLRSPLVYAVPAALVLAAAGRKAAGRIRTTSGSGSSTGEPVEGEEPFALRWLWLGAPFLVILVLGGMLPPVDFDVQEYHLQAPKEWYQQGHISFLPHNVYANMPAGAGMFALLGMGATGDWWLGALIGKTVIAAFAPITALGLLAAGRRLFSASAGVIAALVYISTPWILRVSTDGLVEGAVSLYTLTAIYAAVLWKQHLTDDRAPHHREGNSRGRKAAEGKWREDAGVESRRGADAPGASAHGYSEVERGGAVRFVLLAGYLAGAAVSLKYPPALFLVVPLGAWVVVSQWKIGARRGTDWKSALRRATDWKSVLQRATDWKSVLRRATDWKSVLQRATDWKSVLRRGTDWKSILRIGGAFLLAVTVGCGLWLGKNWVLAGNPTYPLLYEVFGGESWTPEQNQQWNAVHRPHDFSAAALGGDLAKVLLRSEWLSPLLFPLAVLALLDRKRRRLVLGLAGYCAFVVAVWWLATHRIDRFWVPMLSVVALLAGAGACLRGERPWRLTMAIVLLLGLGMNLLTALTVAVRDQAYCVHLARLRLDPSRSDPWHLVFNTRWSDPEFNPAGPDGRLLAVGDAAVFDLEMPVDYATCFDDCPLETLVQGRTPGEIREELHRRRIAMIYVNWGEIQRYRKTYGFSDFVQPEVLDELVAEGVLRPMPMLEEHRGRVYQVR